MNLELPTIDFETYSEAGYVWNSDEQSWECLPGASQNKKGLKIVGAAVYAEHPSTEVLCLFYNMRDGAGEQMWLPSLPPPRALLDYVSAGGVIEAWNVGFEYSIWNKVCRLKYDWPVLKLSQLRCAMAKSRASGYPGKLEVAGPAMRLTAQKDEDGARLLRKFSQPRNPTKSDPRTRIRPTKKPTLVLAGIERFRASGKKVSAQKRKMLERIQADAEDTLKLYEYCAQDVRTEIEASAKTPDLEGEELLFWQYDRAMNVRGVALDTEGVQNCITIVNQAHAKYNAELQVLTGGAVQKASEIQKLADWVMSRGVYTASLDQEHVEDLLAQPELPLDVRKALQLRQAVGSAAVKKVFAMANMVASDGRLHELFSYHAAHTGRITGNGPQPTNMPNSGPAVKHCTECGEFFHTERTCPICGQAGELEEWSPEAAEFALSVIASRELSYVEDYFSDAMAVVSGCLRALFISAPGKNLICSDYSAIEAVVAAMLTGEEWRIEVFRTHGKIYEASAAKITGVPFEEFMLHYGYTKEDLAKPEWWLYDPKGKHHPLRKKIGKFAELACFAADTQVLTRRGYKSIIAVTEDDELWDGIEWIKHRGVVRKGLRKTIKLDGVRMTPQHPISLGHSWKEARELASNASILTRALAIGSENLPWSAPLYAQESWLKSPFNVPAGQIPTPLTYTISEEESPRDAINAPRKRLDGGLNTTGLMPTSARMTHTGGGYSTESLPRLAGVIARTIRGIQTMVAGEFRYSQNGGQINGLFLPTWSACPAGIIPIWKWTGLMLTKAMNRETSGLSPLNSTDKILEKFKRSKLALLNWKNVYDIAHAGPRNRFTIKTASGHLIVHNSGYGGWLGAWKKFGADEYLTDNEIKKAVLAWRAASATFPAMWGGQEKEDEDGNKQPELYGLEGAAIAAIQQPGKVFGYRKIWYKMERGDLICKLPSGRKLVYHDAFLSEGKHGKLAINYWGYNTNPEKGKMGWIKMELYGGLLFENVVQAVSRDILRHAIIQLERAGYKIVLQVYDELVAEVAEGFGSLEELERIMSAMPEWAKGWPVRAKGGFIAKRYRK